MPTNATTFNSRVTSEALEKKFRDTFPAQGGAELIQDLFASGVIVPTVDFTAAAEGSALRTDLQRAWGFATGHNSKATTGTDTLINTTGFWLIDFEIVIFPASGSTRNAELRINDGLGTKTIWKNVLSPSGTTTAVLASSEEFVVFLRSGDSFEVTQSGGVNSEVSYRQIADVNGNLVNPLGFTFS